MKIFIKIAKILGLALIISAFSFPQTFHFQAFEKGESLTYRVKYNLYFNVPVAELNLQVSDEIRSFNGRNCIELKATGKTYKFYDPFFKVRDYFTAYVDEENFQPRLFTRNVHEGSYKKKDYYMFFPEKNYVKSSKGKSYKTPENTWDILSVWYLARSFDYEKMNPGDSIMMNTFVDKENYPIGLRYLGKELIKTSKGTFNCFKIKPLLIAGEIFKSEDDMTLWVSADENKIPIAVESGISVGKIYMELTKYSGLKHELKSKAAS